MSSNAGGWLSEKLDHRACPTTIGRLLRDQKYGLRSHRKVLHTGKSHAQRDQQFQYIAEQREDFRRSRDPRISVDTKKKELVGQFKNAGQTWCEQAEKVNDHDFPSDAVGRAAPYGVYDPERNEGLRDPLDELIAPILGRDVTPESRNVPTRPGTSKQSRCNPLDDLVTDVELRAEASKAAARSVALNKGRRNPLDDLPRDAEVRTDSRKSPTTSKPVPSRVGRRVLKSIPVSMFVVGELLLVGNSAPGREATARSQSQVGASERTQSEVCS